MLINFNLNPKLTTEPKPNYQNNTTAISFRAKKAPKKSIVAAAMSAATLSGMLQVAKDYYQDKEEKISTPNLKKLIERFSFDEKLELMEHEDEISMHQKAFTKIVKEKDATSKKDRFNGDECIVLLSCLDKIEQYPEEYNLIVSAKDDNDNFRFNGYECEKLLQIADKIHRCKETFNLLKNTKNPDNTMRFDAQDIVQLIVYQGENIENYQEAFQNVLNQTNQEDGAETIYSKFKEEKIKTDKNKYEKSKFKIRLDAFKKDLDEKIDSGERVPVEDGRILNNKQLKEIKEYMKGSEARLAYLFEADYEEDVALLNHSQLYAILSVLQYGNLRISFSSLKLNEQSTTKRRFLNGKQTTDALLHSKVKSETARKLLVKCAANSRFKPEEYLYLLKNGEIFETNPFAMSDFECVSSMKTGKSYVYNAKQCLHIIENLDNYPEIKKKVLLARIDN